jgi:hypothetical protein
MVGAACKIPREYQWPGGDAVTRPAFWIQPNNRTGRATQTYDVMATDGPGQHIVATNCYLHWAIRIVDALRITPGRGDY